MEARVGQWLAIGAAIAVAAGCAAVGADLTYYWQSARGHLSVMHEAKPIAELLQQGPVDAGLRPGWNRR